MPAVIGNALKRIIGFEIQFGPFAVSSVRLLAEIAKLIKVEGTVPASVRLRLYVTNTLGNRTEENEYIPQMLKPLADTRRQANAIKRAEPITVVIGNPPYKEKAKGKGGWMSVSATLKLRLLVEFAGSMARRHSLQAPFATYMLSGAGRHGNIPATVPERHRPHRTERAWYASSRWQGF